MAVAVRDLMSGEMVLTENEPALFFTQADRMNFQFPVDPLIEIVFAAYDAFVLATSSAQQQKLLSLYSPTTGMLSDRIRLFLGMMQAFNSHAEMIIKVFRVIMLNMFGRESKDYRVYGEMARFSHSCTSNCVYSFRGKALFCFARRAIKAGDELTISYNRSWDWEPIHERRHKYLETKEFTCHCPRCDAIGDDTRQFDCFDPSCKGVMMVCHPVQKRNVPDSDLVYTGVEYVEPHLLPCTVCHRAAPADYQKTMFAVEKDLLELAPSITERFEVLIGKRIRCEMEPLYKEILQLEIPSRHGASVPLLRVKWRVLHCLYVDKGPKIGLALQQAVVQYVAAMESIITYPGDILSEELSLLAIHCAKLCRPPVFPPLPEKLLCLKALRMHLLLFGRDNREKDLDCVTAACYEKLPSARSPGVCAFCEESPQRAALTLSRCGQCKQVMYCSTGCQKAHWKLHKKTCATGSR